MTDTITLIGHPAKRRCPILVAAIWLLLLAPGAVSAQSASVTASISPDRVGENDQVSLSIAVSGSGNVEQPRLPKISGLKLMSGPSVSNEFRWVNGQTSTLKRFTYVFLPEKTGTVDIPAVPVRVAGKTYRTKALRLEIVPGSTSRPSRRSGRARTRSLLEEMWKDDDLFGRVQPRPRGEVLTVAAVDRKKVFQGQQLTLTYNLLTQVAVSQIEIEDPPRLKGFWVEEIDLPKNPSPEIRSVNGKQYSAYVIKKQALFPTTTGNLEIPSTTFAVTVRSSRGGFFTLGNQERVFRKTGPLSVEVDPLPQPPAEFSGAVGEFKLTSALDRNQAKVGEALTLKVAISGVGNLKTIAQFPLPELPSLEIFSSKSTDTLKIRRGLLQGTKTWEFVLVPQAHGKQVVPALSFSYFLPSAGRYRVAQSSPLEVNVAKVEVALDGGGNRMISQRGLIRQASDIHYIKLPKRALQNRAGFLYESYWPYLTLLFSLILNGGLVLHFRQKSRLQQDVIGVRSRQARKIAHRRLAEASKCLKNNQRAHFHRILEESLTGYLTDKFNLPQIEMTSSQIKRFMETHQLEAALSQEIIVLLEECHFARYAPAQTEHPELQQLLERAEKVIVQLEGELFRSKR